MNNLPNTKRKSENVHSFLAFTFHMLFIYKLLYTGTRVKGITFKCFRTKRPKMHLIN